MSKIERTSFRCAIYTRKSSEEGLEQEFNSLEAQRDACEAYIKSQAHEGWRVLPERFDDGGFSGGTLVRPALQKLLEKIKARKIDVIVLYKIDRLSRSLADFARLAELFETHGVSFVSVTQQFNTTTSMGRLMLNVLLSFAQFERELTGERIRDKILASKKKGLWMGGHIPIGYDAKDRSLIINAPEAETVRMLFQLYLEHGTLRAVRKESQRLGLKTKPRLRADGRQSGGQSFFPGHIHSILKCPLYIGRIPHKRESYPGSHPPIIDQSTWDAVQTKLNENRNGERTRANAKESSPLVGLLVDDKGNRFTPSHAVKAGRRYRYYMDRTLLTGAGEANAKIRRIPAPEIESAVRSGLENFLSEPLRVVDIITEKASAAQTDLAIRQAHRLKQELANATPQNWRSLIRPFLMQIVLSENAVLLRLSRDGLRTVLSPTPHDAQTIDDAASGHSSEDIYNFIVPARIRVRGGVMKLVISDKESADQRNPDPALVKAIVRAHDWFERIRSGQVMSISEIAECSSVSLPYVIRILRLAFLAPDIVEAIVNGRHPIELTADQLTLHEDIPLSWYDQRNKFGFAQI